MNTLTVTRHGETRMHQRGFRNADLEVILTHGTNIGHDRIMLKRRDAKNLVGELALTGSKKEIATIERLTDKTIVVSENHLVTAYHQAAPVRRPKYRGVHPKRPIRIKLRYSSQNLVSHHKKYQAVVVANIQAAVAKVK